MRNPLFKKIYFIQFLNKSKNFILFKFNIERLYRKYFSFYRIHILYLKIIPLDLKLNLLKGEDIKFLSDKQAKKFFKLESLPELGSLFIQLAKIQFHNQIIDLNFLRKLFLKDLNWITNLMIYLVLLLPSQTHQVKFLIPKI